MSGGPAREPVGHRDVDETLPAARVKDHGQFTEYVWNDSGIEIRVGILNEPPPRAGVFKAEVTGGIRETLPRSSTTWRMWLGAGWESAPWW